MAMAITTRLSGINNINEELVCVNKLQESEVLERLRAEIQQRQSNGFGAVLLVVVMSFSFENYGLLEELIRSGRKVGVYSLWIDNSAENISWTVKNILEVLPTNCAELTLVETNQLHKIERTISSTRAVCRQVAKEVAALKDLSSINLETPKVPRLVNYQAVFES
ncbi:MAG: hypothetical protein LBP35_00885 [Candidatus Ancillula trichonymphae]|jgi:putative cell wall-binding protein|nr:hypothetical protein [Candidatus Ancillula trichonymphae]